MNEEMSRTQRILRGTIAAIVISAGVTVLVLPSYVPTPKMSLTIPDQIALGSDVELTLHIYGWQGNYYIECLWLDFDRSNSSRDGKDGLFERIDIVRANYSHGPSYHHATWLGALPFPRTVTYKFKVPLGNMAASGKLGRGRFTGNINVSWSYETPREDPDDRNRSRSHRRNHIFEDVLDSFPFSLQVQ